MTIEQQTSERRVHWNDHPSGPLPVSNPFATPGLPPSTSVVPTSGFAVSSLVWSLVGLVTFGLAAIGGVICGHIALQETRTGSRGGRGMALAGVIIGWVQIGGWLIFWGVVLFGMLLDGAGM